MTSPNTRNWQTPEKEYLSEYDPLTGRKTWFSYLRDGSWQYRHEFGSVAHEVDASKELAKSDDHWNRGVKNDMVHYAHIPDSIMFKWHCEGVNIRDTKELLKMVNKPEWAYLRCTTKIHT